MRRFLLLLLASASPAFLIAGTFLFYMWAGAEFQVLAYILVFLAVPLAAGAVFFCGYRIFETFQRGKRLQVLAEFVLSALSFAASSWWALRLSLAFLQE